MTTKRLAILHVIAGLLCLVTALGEIVTRSLFGFIALQFTLAALNFAMAIVHHRRARA
jgi:hypothetical protein